ncbi:MAG: FHA domain-containing protein [Muribaculaceae bacterium]|nr:FHA domain-containing protein [Muribaculaceae bacterium]
MAEVEKVSLTCKCGNKFQCKAPSSPGNYSVTCTNPQCRAKVSFRYPLTSGQQQPKPKEDVKFGLLEDGSYRFRCNNEGCHQSVLVPAKMVKPGHNRVKCPKCPTYHEFDIPAKEEDLLKCTILGCDGKLKQMHDNDSYCCEKCGAKYSVTVENGKIIKVSLLTEPVSPRPHMRMKLVLGKFLGKKEHILSKGTHYVGRADDTNVSDFAIKDKYASSKSVRIDVNENGGSLVYRMTVERATNPVYHNSRELAVGDIVYLSYGDTLKLGKTLIKVQKIPKPK